MTEKLNAKLKKAIPWTILDGVFNLVYSIAMVVLVGRFLEPAQLGLAAIALAITQFVEAIYAVGMQESVVRANSGHTEQSDTAHTLTLGLSVMGVIICCSAAWPLSYLYDNPEVLTLILVAAIGLPINALFSVPTGLLSRKIRSRTLAGRMMLSKVFSLLTFIVCIYFDLGAWGIIFSTLASSLGSLILIFFTMERWPKIRIIRSEVRGILRYGLTSSGSSFLWIGSQRVFMVLFGVFHGVHALGLFQFALRLVNELAMLLQVTVLRVGLSYFSGLDRNDGDMAKAYLLGTRVLNTLATPVYAGLAVLSPIIIPLIFGHQWDDAIPMIWVLAISWIFVFPKVLIPIIMKAKGLPSYNLSFSVISASCSLIACVATYAVSPVMAALGWGISQVVNLPYQLIILRKKLGITLRTQVKQTLPALFSSALMGGVLWFLKDAMWSGVVAIDVISLIIIGGIVYCTMIALLDRGLMMLFIRQLRSGGKAR